MSIKSLLGNKKVKVLCNEANQDLVNAKNFLYGNLKNKGYSETMGITENTSLTRMLMIIDSLIPYQEQKLYIYNTGYFNEVILSKNELEITNSDATTASVTYEELYIHLHHNSTGFTTQGTKIYMFNDKAPISQYNTVNIEYEVTDYNSTCSFYLLVHNKKTGITTISNADAYVSLIDGFGRKTASLNVSHIDYDCYIGFYTYVSKTFSKIRIYKVWMEK